MDPTFTCLIACNEKNAMKCEYNQERNRFEHENVKFDDEENTHKEKFEDCMS